MSTCSGTLVDGSSHPGPGWLHPHLLLGGNGPQTKRVSVPFGRQMKRARPRHGSYRSLGSEQWVPYMRTKITSVSDGRPPFRYFCHLSYVVLFWCERLSQTVFNHVYSTLFWQLCGSRPTSQFAFHVTLCVWWRKRDLVETILVVIISFLTSFSETIQDRKNSLSFAGSCPVSTYGFRTKNIPKKHKVVAERGCCVVKVGDLVANKVPRKWLLLQNFDNPNDEWL